MRTLYHLLVAILIAFSFKLAIELSAEAYRSLKPQQQAEPKPIPTIKIKPLRTLQQFGTVS